jgi:hypothetical protein
MEIKEVNAKKLLALPVRQWNKIKVYSSIALVNTKKKHDSGWALMAIVGLDDFRNPIEIAGFCDDIEWDFGGLLFRNDMFPSGIIHFWSKEASFEVGFVCSTTTIKLIKLGETIKKQFLMQFAKILIAKRTGKCK